MMATLSDLNGLPLSCKSQDAVKLYDKVLESFCSQNEGFLNELQEALKLDPEFVLARCLMTCFRVESFDGGVNPQVNSDLKFYETVYETVTDREKMHIDAVRTFAKKNSPKACEIWDKISIYYPCDIQAIRWAFGICLEIGEFDRMRDILTRTIHYYPKDASSYPYILSMYAFSLEETDSRDAAEIACTESIQIQPKNPWGIHTLSHVIEEERPSAKGIEFLISCRNNWETSGLSHHIAWHLMLYYLDLNKIDEMFEEYDKSLLPKLSPDNAFGLLDASSLLWRLNVLGIDVGDRWEKVTECFKPRLGTPLLSWLECHLMMSFCHGKLNESTTRLALAHKLLKSMEDYSQKQISLDCQIANILGVPMCNALIAYGEGRYEEASSCIIPLKYNIIKFGGSWAQRQVFFVTLIEAAIRSKDYKNALAQILELKAKKPHSQLLQRLYDQVLELTDGSAPLPKKSRID